LQRIQEITHNTRQREKRTAEDDTSTTMKNDEQTRKDRLLAEEMMEKQNVTNARNK